MTLTDDPASKYIAGIEEQAERDLARLGNGRGPDAVEESAPPLRIVEIGDLSTATLVPPQYVVEKILPRGHVTLLGGHGGLGKTQLALAIAAHLPASAAWAGLDVVQGRAVVLTLEDSGELMRWRLRNIVEAYGLDAQAIARNLVILDGSECGDTALGHDVFEDGHWSLVTTKLTAQLRTVVSHGCDLLVIDNASDGFSGNEIDRQCVRRFVRLLAKIGRDAGAAVLLLAHVDKAAAKYGAQGNSYSGSTAWHNSARSRLALVDADGAIELRHEKSNLGKRIDPIRLRFNEHGVLLVDGAGSAGAGDALVAQADASALLVAIQAAALVDANIPTGRTGPATAQAVLSTLPELPASMRGTNGRARFWAALAALQHDGRAGVQEYVDASRHRRTRIVALEAA